MKTENQIRERIKKLDKYGQKLFEPKTSKDFNKIMIKAYINLGERYSLWWVLGEIKKFQGKTKKLRLKGDEKK